MPYKKKQRPLLPQELIHIKNKDKSFHESWSPGEDPLNFPHPFRILFASGGKPNMRKTNTLKNVIIRQFPPFEKIYLVHCGGFATEEYDDFNAELLEELPEPYDDELFPRKRKTLLILEDLNYTNMNRPTKTKLDRLYGYTSTHQSLTIMTTVQGFFQIPHIVRQMSNVIVLWKTKCIDSMDIIRRRIDMKKEMFYPLIEKYLIEKHDALWIDDTIESPYPIRINGFQILHPEEHKEEDN